MTPRLLAILLIAASLLAGCGGTRTLGSLGDSAPSHPPANVANTPDAVPRKEPLSKLGNPDSYTVLGHTYHVLASSAGFTERGEASWYGRKFQGKMTSSGESYDMYAMTAAHRTLPLPSYVQVTNLDNGRKVVVRVNDRGPFHSNRIIDLSYAAAVRLDMIGNGTAPVALKALPGGAHSADNNAAPALYLQAGAFSQAKNARVLTQRLEQLGQSRVFVSPSRGKTPLYRVRLGPYPDQSALDNARRQLQASGIKVNTLRD